MKRAQRGKHRGFCKACAKLHPADDVPSRVAAVADQKNLQLKAKNRGEEELAGEDDAPSDEALKLNAMPWFDECPTLLGPASWNEASWKRA